MVTIILPAHNEEKIIEEAIMSLKKQTYWDIEIIALLDNCTDNTESIARKFDDVKIFKSRNNKYKKAGALNQLFESYFTEMHNYILVMDADTVLHHKAIEEGVRFLENNIHSGAVCSMAGIIEPEKKNLLWYLQNIEYGFGDTNFIENQGNIFVCRGMYSMYRKAALRNVIKSRNVVYNVESITEDYDLTLVLKKLGYGISNCHKIKAFTDVPTTIKEFFVQRKRWIKGGAEDLIRHGYKKYTYADINKMLIYFLLIIAQILFAVEAIKSCNVNLIWLFVIIGLYYINSIVRIKYIINKDWKMYLILFSMLPVFLYSILDNILTIYGTALAVLKIKTEWR
jgi:cellulose synthase/poly-beta-1,6-N-acetylglucosamine synthase-like glycosyltransferase